MIQNYKGLLLLLAMALFSMWVLKKSPKDSQEEQTFQSKHDVDYFSVGYSKLRMNKLGFPADKLAADYVVHYRDTSEVLLTKPMSTLYAEGQANWITNAEEGVLLDSGEELFLKGEVIINSVPKLDEPFVKITTSNLKVEPKLFYATTADRAEIERGSGVMSGVGLKLFYSTPLRIDLLSKVRGRYE